MVFRVKAKSETVWIIVNDKHGAYVDFRYTRKDMIRHHEETTGKTWSQAKASGDEAIKAILKYDYVPFQTLKP